MLRTLHYDRGHNIPVAAPKDLLAVELGPEASRPAEPLPTLWRELPRLPWSASTYVRPMVLQETESASGVRFAINNQMWPLNQPEMAKLGDTELWSIQNTAEMDHPFHLHGMFFEVVDVDGRPPSHFGWKDRQRAQAGDAALRASRCATSRSECGCSTATLSSMPNVG
jgi:FtsP/CotA-like multicopper oxidase with cupredoxin domain